MDFNNINSQLIGAVKATRAKAAEIKANKMIPSESKAALVDEARSEAHKALSDYAAEVRAGIAEHKAGLKGRRDAAFMPEADGRAWGRVKGLLDAGISPVEIANDAAEREDKAVLKALADEYRAYKWASTGDRNAGDDLNGVLDSAMYEAAGSPEYRTFADELAKAERAEYVIEMNLNRALADTNPNHSEAGSVADTMVDLDRNVVSID